MRPLPPLRLAPSLPSAAGILLVAVALPVAVSVGCKRPEPLAEQTREGSPEDPSASAGTEPAGDPTKNGPEKAAEPARDRTPKTGGDTPGASDEGDGDGDGDEGDGADGEHGAEARSDDHHGQGMRHSFSDVARFRRLFDAPDRDEWQKPEEVVRLLSLEAGMTVVDLGAGTGYFLEHLVDAVGDEGTVLALDVEPNMVAHMEDRAEARGYDQVEARVVEEDDPGLEPASVDRVLIVDTWHHLSDREAYAGSLRKALRPDGFVLVVDFTRDSERGPPKRHKLPATTVVEELEAGGFPDVAVVEETLPDQYVIRARVGD